MGFCADVEDAFHQIPRNQAERRFALASVGGLVLAFRVLVFGSASAPTVWGRFAAFPGRTWSAVADLRVLRVQVYVDDPVYADALQGLCPQCTVMSVVVGSRNAVAGAEAAAQQQVETLERQVDTLQLSLDDAIMAAAA